MAIKPLPSYGTIGPGAMVPRSVYAPKPATRKVLDPFGVPHVTAPGQPAFKLPGVAQSAPMIPNANSIVQPTGNNPAADAAAAVNADPYGTEITSDKMYAIGQKNYQDALAMGERSLLGDPLNKLIATYGYDPRSYLAAHPGSVPQGALDLANKYLDPAALAAAQKDPYSVANQIGKSFGDTLSQIPRRLAARGMDTSGVANIAGANALYDRGLQDKQAMDQFLGGLGTANQNWLDFQTTQGNTWRQAQEDIATRLSQQAGYHEQADAIRRASEAAAAEQQRLAEEQTAQTAAAQDYSGGPNAIYQPAPATAKLIQKMRNAGQFSAWEKAMQKLGSTTKTGPGVIVPKKMAI